MRKPIFTGAGTAIITPFTEDGVDYEKLRETIEFQISKGIDAIVVAGTTGEASTMPDDEHLTVIKFVVKNVKKRVPVIAGTGSNDTKHAIELSKQAEAIGADALLSVTPYYNKTSQKGLYEHFKLIAKNVKIPIVLYNVPSRTAMNISSDTVKALSEIENIVAIKECNLSQAGEITNLCGDNFTIYSGEDGMILPFLTFGAKGVISVMSNIIPNEAHNMVMEFLNGNVNEAIKLQLSVVDLIKALFIEVNPMPVKAAMNLMGMNVGKCRMPLIEISDKNLEFLKNALLDFGLIK